MLPIQYFSSLVSPVMCKGLGNCYSYFSIGPCIDCECEHISYAWHSSISTKFMVHAAQQHLRQCMGLHGNVNAYTLQEMHFGQCWTQTQTANVTQTHHICSKGDVALGFELWIHKRGIFYAYALRLPDGNSIHLRSLLAVCIYNPY